MRKPAFQLGIVIIAVVLILLLAVYGQQPASNPPAQLDVTATNLPDVIDVSQAYALYMNNTAYLLDVRDRQEWDQLHIPSTTLLPLIQVSALASKMPTDKPIIVISGADNRSSQARDMIRQAGILNVSSLMGGLDAWRRQGYPTEP